MSNPRITSKRFGSVAEATRVIDQLIEVGPILLERLNPEQLKILNDRLNNPFPIAPTAEAFLRICEQVGLSTMVLTEARHQATAIQFCEAAGNHLSTLKNEQSINSSMLAYQMAGTQLFRGYSGEWFVDQIGKAKERALTRRTLARAGHGPAGS